MNNAITALNIETLHRAVLYLCFAVLILLVSGCTSIPIGVSSTPVPTVASASDEAATPTPVPDTTEVAQPEITQPAPTELPTSPAMQVETMDFSIDEFSQGRVFGMARENDYLYIGELYLLESIRLLVFDITDEADPQLVAIITPAGASDANFPRDLVVEDGRAYILTTSHLHVLDVSTPTSPVHRVRYTIDASSIVVQDGIVYAVKEVDGKITVIDMTDLGQPIEVASALFGEDLFYWTLGGPLGIQGDKLFVYWTLEVFDISNPSDPFSLGTVCATQEKCRFTADTGYLYVLTEEDVVPAVAGDFEPADGSFKVVDLSDPGQFSVIGSVSDITGKAITVVGDRAYVILSEGRDDAIGVFDLSDKTEPTLLTTVESEEDLGFYFTLSRDGRYAYLDDLRVVDLTDPDQPIIQEPFQSGSEASTTQAPAIKVFQATPTPLPPLASLVTGDIDTERALEQMEQGIIALEAGDPETALVSLNEALAADPTLVDAYFYRGIAYSLSTAYWRGGDDGRLGIDPALAIVDFSRVLVEDPDRMEAYWLRAYANAQFAGNSEAIQADLQILVERDVLGVDADMLRIIYADVDTNGDGDRGKLQQMLAASAKDPELFAEYYILWLGVYPFASGGVEDDPAILPEILAVAEAIIENDPDHADAHGTRGIMQAMIGEDMEAAYEDLTRWFELAEDYMALANGEVAGGPAYERFDRNDPLTAYRHAIQGEARDTYLGMSLYIGFYPYPE